MIDNDDICAVFGGSPTMESCPALSGFFFSMYKLRTLSNTFSPSNLAQVLL
jgi:hypothetical protein